LHGGRGGLTRHRSGQGRRFLQQGTTERIQGGSVSLGVNDDLTEPVLNPATHAQSLCEAIDEWPEANTLDPAGQDQMARLGRGSG
jgi:hypothetical protein